MLFDLLKEKDCTIQCISLRDNKLTDGCLISIGEYLTHNKHIKKLYLDDNKLTNEGMKILYLYLMQPTSLRVLGLSGNAAITQISFPLLVGMMEISHIENLDLNFTCVRPNQELAFLSASNKLKNGTESSFMNQL